MKSFLYYEGSAGKLSHAAQRLGLLSGIGRFSYHLVSGVSSIESLSSAVVDMFLSFLQAEGCMNIFFAINSIHIFYNRLFLTFADQQEWRKILK